MADILIELNQLFQELIHPILLISFALKQDLEILEMALAFLGFMCIPRRKVVTALQECKET